MSTSSVQAQAEMMPSPKQQFLNAYEREHAITMRVLRAYPTDQLDLKPHAKLKTARELAWMFVLERMLGTGVCNDTFVENAGRQPPPPPESWDDLLGMLEQAHTDFGRLINALSDSDMHERVRFFTGPKTLGQVTRMEFCWFLLNDQIHHRGQFSVYLRMADGRVPSIYGPTADEPWT